MSTTHPIDLPVVIRRAGAEDAAALTRLAALDSARVPEGRLLVAEVGTELWAAVSYAGAIIADPFRPTADLVSLLCLRAEQLGRAESDHQRSPGLGVPTRPTRPRRLARLLGTA